MSEALGPDHGVPEIDQGKQRHGGSQVEHCVISSKQSDSSEPVARRDQPEEQDEYCEPKAEGGQCHWSAPFGRCGLDAGGVVAQNGRT
jgi:hypothetical protein